MVTAGSKWLQGQWRVISSAIWLPDYQGVSELAVSIITHLWLVSGSNPTMTPLPPLKKQASYGVMSGSSPQWILVTQEKATSSALSPAFSLTGSTVRSLQGPKLIPASQAPSSRWKWRWSRSVESDSLRPRGLTVACQAPLSMGFYRHEHWSGVPLPSPVLLPKTALERPACATTQRTPACFRGASNICPHRPLPGGLCLSARRGGSMGPITGHSSRSDWGC